MTTQPSNNTKHSIPFNTLLILLIFSVFLLQLVPIGLVEHLNDPEVSSELPILIVYDTSNEIEKAVIHARVKGLTFFLYFNGLSKGLTYLSDSYDFTMLIKYLAPLTIDYRDIMKRNIMSFTNGNNFK